jgi:hypothetical protein
LIALRNRRPGRFRFRSVAILSALTLLAAACTGDTGPPTSDVAGPIPWPQTETAAYQLKNKDGDLVGSGVLSIAPEAGKTRLAQRFTSPASTDEASVLVESATLKPVSSVRKVDTPSGDETVEATYTEDGVLIKQGDRQSGLYVKLVL